jgi:hypothetical protein
LLTHRPVHTGALAVIVAGALTLGIPASAGAGAPPSNRVSPRSTTYATTLRYVTRFYPRWFTARQSASSGHINGLLGPSRISPVYRAVVAINDDTLYSSAFVDLADQPMILTIPQTTITYSLLTLDAYGDIFQTNIPPETPGPGSKIPVASAPWHEGRGVRPR